MADSEILDKDIKKNTPESTDEKTDSDQDVPQETIPVATEAAKYDGKNLKIC